MIVRVLGEEIPYARWLLRILRDRSSNVESFRWALRRAGWLLALEASEELEWSNVEVETPLGYSVRELELQRPPLVVEILGAGLPLAEGVLDVYPNAPIALVAARRIEEGRDLRVEITYERLPANWEGAAFIVDPMLATGMTISKVVEVLDRINVVKVIVLSVIAAPEGVKTLFKAKSDAVLYTLVIDKGLNDKYF
ncbi:MAG: uracil phosphoribosyltransferase, partial [Desulfurococcales archaeon]|nr:uracil phosphoribosyltransferase [Desulfurococcales archaeon]